MEDETQVEAPPEDEETVEQEETQEDAVTPDAEPEAPVDEPDDDDDGSEEKAPWEDELRAMVDKGENTESDASGDDEPAVTDDEEPVADEAPEDEPGLTEQGDDQQAAYAPDYALAIRAAKAGIPPERFQALAAQGQEALETVVDMLAPVEDETQPPDEEAFKFEPFKLEGKLDPDVWPEDMQAVLNELVEHNNTQGTAMAERVSTYEAAQAAEKAAADEARQADQFAQRVEQFDAFVTDLGDEYEDLLGKGASVGLDKASDTLALRQRIFDSAADLVVGQEARGQRYDIKAIYQKALNAELGDQQIPITRRRIASEVKARKPLLSAKPTARDTKDTRSTEQRITANVEDMMRERGVNEWGEDAPSDE